MMAKMRYESVVRQTRCVMWFLYRTFSITPHNHSRSILKSTTEGVSLACLIWHAIFGIFHDTGIRRAPFHWVGSSLEDLRSFPEEVQDGMGYALYLAQCGERHGGAKTRSGVDSKQISCGSQPPPEPGRVNRHGHV